MSDYEGDTPIPGLTADQQLAVAMALECVPPDLHDGLSRAINAGLGDTGGAVSNAMVIAAITVALIRGSGLAIPSTLFPGANLTADANQIHAAKSGLGGSVSLQAKAN
jgi:hypothetical protein